MKKNWLKNKEKWKRKKQKKRERRQEIAAKNKALKRIRKVPRPT